nr:hypothetical protein CFP56_07882 [Quercus suber]
MGPIEREKGGSGRREEDSWTYHGLRRRTCSGHVCNTIPGPGILDSMSMGEGSGTSGRETWKFDEVRDGQSGGELRWTGLQMLEPCAHDHVANALYKVGTVPNRYTSGVYDIG